MLNGLFGIWSEAQTRNEPTITFEIAINQGRFLFMMFFDPDDAKTKDQLLVFLQNTQYMLRLKLYGSHKQGNFQIYLSQADIEAIKRELKLAGHGALFEITQFIDTLNFRIPDSLPLARKIEVLRANLAAIASHLNDILDFAARTELIGEIRLPSNKRPQEKTLRKLYLYSTDSPDAVAQYIGSLKKRNCTLAWRLPNGC